MSTTKYDKMEYFLASAESLCHKRVGESFLGLAEKIMIWECEICRRTILGKQEKNRIVPESLYWHGSMDKVFCSAKCSLQWHYFMPVANASLMTLST